MIDYPRDPFAFSQSRQNSFDGGGAVQGALGELDLSLGLGTVGTPVDGIPKLSRGRGPAIELDTLESGRRVAGTLGWARI
jgi:hypothetical protein